MAFYDSPEEFAKDLKISLEQAEMWCKNQKKIQEEVEHARLCPKCGKHTLEYEIGSYEEGDQDYIFCGNEEVPSIDEDGCGYLACCEYCILPSDENVALHPWYDFDILLEMKGSGMEEIINNGGLEAWNTFVQEQFDSTFKTKLVHDLKLGTLV